MRFDGRKLRKRGQESLVWFRRMPRGRRWAFIVIAVCLVAGLLWHFSERKRDEAVLRFLLHLGPIPQDATDLYIAGPHGFSFDGPPSGVVYVDSNWPDPGPIFLRFHASEKSISAFVASGSAWPALSMDRFDSRHGKPVESIPYLRQLQMYPWFVVANPSKGRAYYFPNNGEGWGWLIVDDTHQEVLVYATYD